MRQGIPKQPIVAILYGSVPAIFQTDLPLDQADARLRETTGKSPLHSLTYEVAVGTVTAQWVSHPRSITFVGNSFKPYFEGRFNTEAGRTVLRGTFSMHWTVKAFITFWFGLCLFRTLLATVIAFAKPRDAWFFPFAGIGMILIGVTLVHLSKWFARNDTNYQSSVFENALRSNGASGIELPRQ